MENSVREFAAEQPNADYAAIVKWFGSPEKIAESYVAEMDAAELVQSIKIRYNVLLIVMVAVAICVALRFITLATAYYKYVDNVTGYAVVEIIEVERVETDEGGK